MADSIFIGHGVGPLAISGLALTFPLMNLAAAFGSLVGVGASTLVSVKLGQKDYEGANKVLGNVLVLNPLFIFGFGWGIKGSAWATVISQVISLTGQLIHFSRPKELLHFKKGIYRLKSEIVKGILYIGMSKKAIFLSLIRQMLFLVPCLLILPRWLGTLGVWISILIADTTATIVTTLVLINQFRKFHSK